MTLVEFLRARIAADEERLLRLKGTDGPRYGYGTNASLLAECEAKRRIIADAQDRAQIAGVDDSVEAASVNAAYEDVLWSLAFPYADHPDFRDEWRPH